MHEIPFLIPLHLIYKIHLKQEKSIYIVLQYMYIYKVQYVHAYSIWIDLCGYFHSVVYLELYPGSSSV